MQESPFGVPMIPQLRMNDSSPIPMERSARRLWRIVHVVPNVGPGSGGPANVAARISAAQASLGHEVTIISALAKNERYSFQQSIQNVPGFNRVRLLLSPWTGTFANWCGLRLSPLFRSLFPFVDVVHIHGIWETLILQAAADAKRAGVPYIVRPCGMLDVWSMKHHRFRKKIALTVAHRRMLNDAARFHTLNIDESQLMGPLKLKPPHVIIPNGVFLDEVDAAGGDERFNAATPRLGDRRFILFMGRLDHKKGLDYLAKAFAKIALIHTNIDLVMVGPEGPALKPFQDVIAAANLTSRVHITGPLYGDAKFAALRRAACFCLPSRQEGFSLAITEALASGTPVAISSQCHFPQVQTAGAGVIFDLTVEGVAQGLDRILSATPHACENMGIAGRQLVERSFTWGRVAEQTTEMYESVCSRTRTANSPR